MMIKGWQGFTTLDYPDRFASMIFTGGCNLRCPYCHNLGLAERPEDYETIPVDTVIERLRERAGFIDGLVISGGEPTIQPDLPQFVRLVIDETGLPVKLDTNGLKPQVLEQLLGENALDYVALDVKTSPERYPQLLHVYWEPIARTIGLLRSSGIPYEFRTTCNPEFVDEDVCRTINEWLAPGELYYLQPEVQDGRLITSLKSVRAYRQLLLESGALVYVRGELDFQEARLSA